MAQRFPSDLFLLNLRRPAGFIANCILHNTQAQSWRLPEEVTSKRLFLKRYPATTQRFPDDLFLLNLRRPTCCKTSKGAAFLMPLTVTTTSSSIDGDNGNGFGDVGGGGPDT
uniref:Uncharacterized protein n=1 Tax=Oryza brachyantha TaxID=4533 RepID=J3LW95_ORYBR